MRTLAAALVLALPATLLAQAPAGVPLPQAVSAGTARLSFWGFAVYDAQLWVTPGFRRASFDGSPMKNIRLLSPW